MSQLEALQWQNNIPDIKTNDTYHMVSVVFLTDHLRLPSTILIVSLDSFVLLRSRSGCKASCMSEPSSFRLWLYPLTWVSIVSQISLLTSRRTFNAMNFPLISNFPLILNFPLMSHTCNIYNSSMQAWASWGTVKASAKEVRRLLMVERGRLFRGCYVKVLCKPLWSTLIPKRTTTPDPAFKEKTVNWLKAYLNVRK